MKIGMQLRYFMPLMMMVAGFVILAAYTIFDVRYQYGNMRKNAIETIGVRGHRMVSEIETQELLAQHNREQLLRLLSRYMVHRLVSACVIDENGRTIFQSAPVHYDRSAAADKIGMMRYVKQQMQSKIFFDEQKQSIVGLFPLKMPTEEGKVRSVKNGMLYIEFDMYDRYYATKKEIWINFYAHAAMVMGMALFLYLLMYLLVFKRLLKLHATTLKIKAGDFNARLKVDGDDELSSVMRVFNETAKTVHDQFVQLEGYKNDLELQVQQESQKRQIQEAMLMQQSRLAAMGEMIGNIAHQWRQPLSALNLVIGNIKDAHANGRLSDEYLEKATEKSYRLIKKMSTTIDDFRNFFQPDKERKSFRIKETIDESISLLEAALKNDNISIEISSCEDDEVYGFPNEFSQVVMNILNNAKDVLLERGVKNPTIFIRTEKKSQRLTLCIEDNAGGISESIMDRVFEPYFTTKEQGRGTGIGLYMSKIIIEEHNHGKLSVSNGKHGAIFAIELKQQTATEDGL